MSDYRLPAVEIGRCRSKTCKWQKTRWIAGRGGRFQKCEGCGDRFPCKSACTHLDCAEAKALLGEEPVSTKVSKKAATEHDKLAPEATSIAPAVERSEGDAAPANVGVDLFGAQTDDATTDEEEDTGWGCT